MTSTPPPRRNSQKTAKPVRERSSEPAPPPNNSGLSTDSGSSQSGAKRTKKDRGKAKARDESGESKQRAKGVVRPSSDQESDTPMHKVAIGLYIVIVVFGWCAMANSYHSEVVGRPEVIETYSDAISGLLMVIAMIWTFVKSSVVYLASVPSVIEHTFRNAIIIPIGMLLAAVGVYLFVHLTDKVEQDLSKGFEHSKYRRVAKGEWSDRKTRRRK